MSKNRDAVPVLMYHKVGLPVHSRADRFLNVSALDFQRQMRVMIQLGYQARSFADVIEAQIRCKSLPRRAFAVTFDDGYDCIGEFAAPILRAFRIPATVFVVPRGVGRTNEWDSVTGRAVIPLMNWEMLDKLRREGWEMGGHTLTHPHLDSLEDLPALRDITEGKREIEAHIGQPISTFCYPFGHYNKRTPELVRQAGFAGACTTHTGLVRPGGNPLLTPRIKIAYRDGVFGMLYRMLVRPDLPDFRPNRRDGVHV